MTRTPALAVIVACAGACSPPQARTPFLRSVDLVDMTDHVAQSFAGDPAIGARDGRQEAWVVSIDKVVNHTNQIIPQREKWLYVSRLRAMLAVSEIGRRHAIVWVVPPEHHVAAGDLETGGPQGIDRLPPTHVLSAEFYTLTNTSRRGRSDMYLCSYQLTDLRDGRLVWEDAWEVKRAVSGVTYD